MNYKHLVLGGLLFAAAPQLLAQSVTAGIDAWRKQDYAGAVAIWRPLAEKGDADAAFNLGQAYRLGRGVPTNLSIAKSWFERAARQGHVDAQTTLGLLLFQNGNQTAGLRWLKGAAERGDARAMLIYGTALFNGDGIAQDPVLGYAYVSRAAAQGLAPAKQTLEQMDQVMPLEDRKKGLAIAMAKAKAAPPAPAAPKKTVKAAAVKVPAKPATVQAKPVTKVPAPAAATGAWRIQLGAFSQRSSAEALYRKLSGSLGGRQAYYVAAGPVTRLQVGPYESKAAAAAACRAVAQACFPVAGK
jgi:hypothetical protein